MAGDRRGLPSSTVYFICQGAVTLAWWGLVAAAPAWRRWFAFGDDGASLRPFLAADLVFWVVGSWLAAWGEWRGAAWAATVRAVLCGGIACSVLHATALALAAGAGWSGVLLMLAALGLTAWFTWRSLPWHSPPPCHFH
jgi:hypothetical protein